jgi:hypothetical protein
MQLQNSDKKAAVSNYFFTVAKGNPKSENHKLPAKTVLRANFPELPPATEELPRLANQINLASRIEDPSKNRNK